MRIPARGPGRPRKWKSPLIQWRTDIPLEDFEFAEEKRTELGLSRAEFFHALLHHTNWSVVELQSENKKKDERIKELEKENSELKRLVERLQNELEKWRFRAEACEKNKPKLSSKWSKILLAIPQAVEEGLTWNDLMRRLNIVDPQEQVAVMQRFFITIDENGKIPEVIRPIDGIKELEGIVLYRKDGVNVRFAKIVREDTLKALRSLKVEAPKPAKDGQPAVEVPREKVEENLRKWLEHYEQLASNWRTRSQAESFLKSVGNNGLRRLVREYGFDVVAEVVGSNADFRALFGPFLLKFDKKKLEVTSDV